MRTVEPDESTHANDSISSGFQAFLLAEYNNIAQAYFNTVDALASFIKHYIVIASIPFAVAAVFLNTEAAGAAGVLRYIDGHPLIVPVFLTVISLIGLLVLAYVINIRLDAILYARTVNGIRKYFYDRSGLRVTDQVHIRTLPTSTELPSYIEPAYFGSVVLTFTLVDAAYFGSGWYFFWTDQQLWLSWYVLAVGLFAAAHWVMYVMLARHRQRSYLQQQLIQ